MSQAFFTSIAGINAAQSKIDVVADNIANMNTVAFKSSNLNFQNVYSRIISSGSSPTTESGGTNPKQVGLGVTIGSITRNFNGGTIQSTGRSSDLNIQGTGFFTLQGTDSGMVLSRAGNFTLDSKGNLVTPNGLKVLGTDKNYTQTGDATTIKVPPSLKLTKTGLDLVAAGVAGTDVVSNFNSAVITEGTFSLKVSDNAVPAGVHTVSVDTTGCTKLSEIINKINSAIESYTEGSPAATVFSTRTGTGTAADPYVYSGRSITAKANTDGTVSITANGTGTGNPQSISFVAGTSNFLNSTGLISATKTASGEYKSDVLSQQVSVSEGVPGSTDPTMISYSIGVDGAIEATYSNGDKISVENNDAGDGKQLVYKTSTGDIIRSNDILPSSPDVLKASNLQLQIASVVNEEGLISKGSNLYTVGPSSGSVTFSVGNSNGFGAIASGGLEASNVDLPTEFAQMILAQRAIDANSRTFSTMNQVMSALVNLGR